ncbi:hypothetical protein [Pseudoneobacillus sp. C159]
MQFVKPKYIMFVIVTILLISCWEFYYKEHFPVVSNSAKETGNRMIPKNKELVRLMDQSLNYQIHNRVIEKTAFLKNNDIRHYSMYILPDYHLVPGKDGADYLYYTTNKDIYMKIEFIPKHVHLALIKNNTKKELSNLTNGIIFESSLESQYLDESVRLEIFNDQKIISAYLLHFPEMKLKLTIFTPRNEDLRDPFIQMANTIMLDRTIQ